MADMQELRRKVDAADEKILLALSERAQVCRAIGKEKKKMGVPVVDVGRENEVFKRVEQKSAQYGLDSTSVLEVYREIIKLCRCVQE
jgi:chorismate mutase